MLKGKLTLKESKHLINAASGSLGYFICLLKKTCMKCYSFSTNTCVFELLKVLREDHGKGKKKLEDVY